MNTFWQNFKAKLAFLKIISPVVSIGLAFVVVVGAGTVYYIEKHLKSEVSQDEEIIEDEAGEAPLDENAKEEVKKKPPKYSWSGSSKKVGSATIVSDGPITAEDIEKLNKYGSQGGASDIYYNDTTGRYPVLGDMLKSYINNQLLHGSELPYMYEIEMIDCSSCAYGGLYTGSYYTQGSDITRAFGWIKLNTYYYKDSPYFEDYMRLILSHEYGHHYTLYHKWVDLDIPYGERFPAVYYTIRPLSYANTTWDYSLGWANCDAEIVTEDYSYFYSGYGSHAMAGSRGYPSSLTNTWLHDMTSNPVAGGTPTDQPPSVSITSPSDGAEVSGAVAVSANASDDNGVSRVEFYIDESILATDTSSPYQASWNTQVYANSSHTIKAVAFDATQSIQRSISVTVNNAGPGGDEENPVAVVNQPVPSPYSWNSGNLIIEATGSDNIGVTKMEFYINDYLVATENSYRIIRLWMAEGTPAGSYDLKAKAYDAAGNINQTAVTVNKGF